MGVEESPCSCLLSVFAALRALLCDVIDRLPLLGTLQNTVFYGLFIKCLSYTMPMLQASITFIFLSLHLPFFCKQLNETTKVGTCFNWIATILQYCAILSPSSLTTLDVTFPYTDTSKMWSDAPGRDWVGLQMGNSWEQLSTRTKLLYPKGYQGHYLLAHVSVSGRGSHGWVANYGALKKAFFVWGSLKDFGATSG